jgi:hypothetical protein
VNQSQTTWEDAFLLAPWEGEVMALRWQTQRTGIRMDIDHCQLEKKGAALPVE